jgi:peroxiredoxin
MSDSPFVYRIGKKRLSFFVLLGVTLVTLNVALVIQNRALKAAAGNPGGGRSIVLKPGKVLPALTGMDTEGRELTFGFGADPRRTVLLVFSPRCPYCNENMPNWKAIARGIDAKSFRVVAVSTSAEGVKEYVAKHELTNVSVIADVEPKNRVEYEMNLTPQTVLIAPDGTAEKVWTGRIGAAERGEVEERLGVQLPAPDHN